MKGWRVVEVVLAVLLVLALLWLGVYVAAP